MKRHYKTSALGLMFVYLIVSVSSCKKDDQLDSDLQVPTSPAADPVYTVLTPVNHAITNRIGGYYIGLPSNYDRSDDVYPLLLYMHGAGQLGNGKNDLSLLLNDGVAQVISDKKFPGSFKVNGKSYSFIVFVPQDESFPGAGDIDDCIAFAKKTWRIDTTRIYLSGLSAGSMASCDLAAEVPSKIAALVLMAGVSQDYAYTDKCQKIAAANLPVWVFHSADDPQVNVWQAKDFVAKLISLEPGILPKLTVWPNGGHDAWTRAVDPSYKENSLNIYEWMLQYHR